jgi:hypothetical protein
MTIKALCVLAGDDGLHHACLAEGEGRNAVHLAQLGHVVLAQDISPVGLAKARALAALRPGGLLILEAYTPRQLAFGTGGPPSEALLIEPEVLRQELAGLELLVLQECERWIEEGP